MIIGIITNVYTIMSTVTQYSRKLNVGFDVHVPSDDNKDVNETR